MEHRRVISTLLSIAIIFTSIAIPYTGNDKQTTNAATEALHITSVSAGAYHTCALLSDGSVRCWGLDDYGQTDALPGPFTKIASGRLFSCGLRLDGTVSCWGGKELFEYPPEGTFQSIEVGEFAVHGCGIRADNTVSCWGTNVYGRLNVPTNTTFTQISGNYYFTCGVKTDGHLTCWDMYAPYSLPTDLFQEISVGADMGNYCGIKTDGTIVCNVDYLIGQPPTGQFKKIDLGRYHACAISFDDTVSCWGDNTFGGTNAPAGTFVDISVGEMHSCALGTDGRLLCWGDNYEGALSPLSFSPSDLSFALLNIYYDQPITLSGGNAPYAFEVVSGNLPPGLEFNNGHFSGIPTALGKFTITVLATDAYGFTGEKTYMISVNAPIFLPIIFKH